ncbi:hypothetical protein HDU93_002089 [Gonapodya sp. JEL0774]|nr:hypothetical protein HDU93_002089 [Gonapodya sp. JEL0774]
MQFLCVAPKVGATTVVFPRFDIGQALAAWAKYKVSNIAVVPPIANVIAKHPIVDKFDLSALETIGCGAAPLGGEVEDMLAKRFNVVVQQGYGCTEGTCAATLYRHDTPYHRGSVGTPLPNMEIKVVDPDTGKLVGFNKEGELWFKGPNVCKGYINNPEATKGSFTDDGFYKTGDIVVINENRIMWVRDRLKELIKYNAFQVAPAELEDVLNSHPLVEDAAVTGAPSDEHGEVPKAYIVLKPGVERSDKVAKDIMAFMDKTVAPHKRLRGGLEFRDVIPKNPSGKILRRMLRDEERERIAKAKATARL